MTAQATHTARPGQGLDRMTAGATFAQRHVFAYEGVGYVREVGAHVSPSTYARPVVVVMPAPILRGARALPVAVYAAAGLALGVVALAALRALGVL